MVARKEGDFLAILSSLGRTDCRSMDAAGHVILRYAASATQTSPLGSVVCKAVY
jgi:hypothetical protein